MEVLAIKKAEEAIELYGQAFEAVNKDSDQ